MRKNWVRLTRNRAEYVGEEYKCFIFNNKIQANQHVDSYRLRLLSHCLPPDTAVGRNLHAAGFQAKKLCLLSTFFFESRGEGLFYIFVQWNLHLNSYFLMFKGTRVGPPPKGCSLSILACCLFGKRARALQMQVVSFTQKTIMLPESINVTFRNSALVLRIRHSD